MKPFSNEIIHFLNNFHISNAKSIPNSKFSKQSKEFLKEIFILMKQGDEYYEKHKDKIDFIEHLENIEHKNTSIGNALDYIPEKIKKTILEMKGKWYEYNFVIYTKKYRVGFYTENKNLLELNKNIKKIFIWFFIANAYSNAKCSQYLNVNIFLTNLKKVLPNHEKIIKQEHANTAFTTSCRKNTEINIFREEEWFKVLIHESFHCSGMDFSELDDSYSNKKILSLFPVNADVRLFETYCEMWAEIINIMFISYHSISWNENLDEVIYKLISKTEKMLQYERLFSLFQCAKILYFFGIQYNNLYESTLKSKQLRTRYKEETNVLSYYIIKSIFMYYVNDFVEWCIENNDENGTLNFNKNNENIDSYIEFIKEHYLNSYYTSSLSLFENWYKNITEKSVSVEIYNTLRMSAIEE